MIDDVAPDALRREFFALGPDVRAKVTDEDTRQEVTGPGQ
jgi:hypothetical protein